ncbi:MAG: hypothetical protein Q7J44_09855 [Pseudotabrizicola sp.]|uniref:hypothetical protein n=1 Tax=Pseudotabrizicola sp. TaxID=2939647 RepID=UPI002720483A|nr:hypothetical protein [Pseudotabrizicola sp.]MDO9638835.1 hypothetical protein [Pseudotabrizicola sp.]
MVYHTPHDPLRVCKPINRLYQWAYRTILLQCPARLEYFACKTKMNDEGDLENYAQRIGEFH